MKTPSKVVSFALALVVMFGAGYALGTAVGPFEDDAPGKHQRMEMDR